MDVPCALELGYADVVVFSRASPDKSSPNEDSAAVFHLAPGVTVLAVADGLGGSRDGQSASATAVHCLGRALCDVAHDDAALRAGVLNGLEAANAEILARGVGAATTLVVAMVVHDRIRVFHVGDSALLQVGQRGRMVQQTVAHSPVGFAEAAGMLTEEEALHHEERHFVSNTLGSADMRIEVGPSLALKRRDTVLLATDGLFDNLRVEEIVERVRIGALSQAGGRLQASAQHRMATPESQQPSKPDDLTFVLFRRAT